MGDHQVPEELDVDRVVASHLLLEVLDQLGEHLFEHGQLDNVVDREHLNRDGLVDRQDLLDGWAIISDQDASSLFELTLLQVGLGELHEVRVQHLLSLLLGELEALLPLASLVEHLEARHVSALDDLVELRQHLLKMCRRLM